MVLPVAYNHTTMNGIITTIHKQRLIKRILSTFSFSEDPYRDKELRADFESEIYLILLEYPDKKLLRELHDRGELSHFIFGIVKRNFLLGNSMYYKKYKNYENNRVELNTQDERFILAHHLYYNEPYAYL